MYKCFTFLKSHTGQSSVFLLSQFSSCCRYLYSGHPSYLTKADWKNGWPEYKYRQQLENWDSRKTLDCPVWDFRKVKHLYIHGEQGVGDEIMFLSCIDEVLPLADKITIEVNKKVTEIVRQ